MGYRKMTPEDLYEIYRRWCAGHTIARIAKTESCTRKTVQKYIGKIQKAGYIRKWGCPERAVFYEMIKKILPSNERPKTAANQLAAHEEELRELIHDSKEAVKPKTAFEIIREKYGIRCSYETFKIFARQNGLVKKPKRQMIRIELPAGLETQIDYGKVGLLVDPHTRSNRVVWAFCGILSHARLPFIQFVHTQDQSSFVESFIDMFEFYDGATEVQSIDNLKSGVIKPDLWDPKINKALSEMAEHYGVFIDPCRVGKSTDKGKIERLVPVARVLFRKLKKVHFTAMIDELNSHALLWCKETYGSKEHGTTGIAPLEEYEQVEREKLKRLPEERFEVPVWKPAKVHGGDQFFTFDTKRYSLPEGYKGKQVWGRYTHRNRLLHVFFDRRLIRTYVVSRERIQYVEEDFPPVKREMMNGGYPRYLLEQSRRYGEAGYELIESILKPHAYLNARRAQGMLEVMKVYVGQGCFAEVCREAVRRHVKVPSTFKAMMKAHQEQHLLNLGLEISEEGKAMVRDVGYYFS